MDGLQVTVVAEEDCEVLVFDVHHLDRVYEICPKFNLILDCLVSYFRIHYLRRSPKKTKAEMLGLSMDLQFE